VTSFFSVSFLFFQIANTCITGGASAVSGIRVNADVSGFILANLVILNFKNGLQMCKYTLIYD